MSQGPLSDRADYLVANALAPATDWEMFTAASKIQNVHSGLVMAVNGASTADEAQVTQWTDNGTTDHLWRLVQALRRHLWPGRRDSGGGSA